MISVTGRRDHSPVLISTIIDKISPVTGIWIDGTFGAGGYTEAFLNAGANFVIGIDRDPEVQKYADHKLLKHKGNFSFIPEKFSNLCRVARELGYDLVDGVILDLGVSSMQIDSKIRGFSFRYDAPLDMRMSKTGVSAEEVLNELPESELSDIFLKFGEESKSRLIAREIVKTRSKMKLSSTLDLVKIIEKVVKPGPNTRIHPATRCFQALRIFVNKELDELKRTLVESQKILREGGFLIVVSFHSLEDRIVKNFFRYSSSSRPRESRYFPEIEEHNSTFEIITKKPIVPSFDERLENSRSTSAKCRIAIRTGQPYKNKTQMAHQ